MDYLISKGVEKSRLTATGYGATNFIADNKTDEGRKENRRVEIVQK
jgi:OOP family OmpA-OmpF porin